MIKKWLKNILRRKHRKLDFPLKFDKCPLCGETKHVARTIADELVEKGKMTPGKPTGTNLGQAIIMDPAKTVLTAPHILKVYDVCSRCGYEHIVYVECKEAGVTTKAPSTPAAMSQAQIQAIQQQQMKKR